MAEMSDHQGLIVVLDGQVYKGIQVENIRLTNKYTTFDEDTRKVFPVGDISSNFQIFNKRRELVACNTLITCSSWNSENDCLWVSGSCTTNVGYSKTLNDYEECKDSSLSNTYWYDYESDSYIDFPDSEAELKHQASGSSIQSGIFCEWKYNSNSKNVHNLAITQQDSFSQEFEIYLEGSKGENLVLKNTDLTRLDVKLDVYNAAKIKVSTVQLTSQAESSYT